MTPCGDAVWDARDFAPEVDAQACRLRNAAPRCPHCGALARPNVLMFGDGAWIARRTEAQARRMEAWLRTVRRPVVIEVGAGTAIPSVRLFGQRVVQELGGRLVRINPREPAVADRRDVGIALGAVAALEAIELCMRD
jgi:NAD-dependent SIR2 family protein deacetylase